MIISVKRRMPTNDYDAAWAASRLSEKISTLASPTLRETPVPILVNLFWNQIKMKPNYNGLKKLDSSSDS